MRRGAPWLAVTTCVFALSGASSAIAMPIGGGAQASAPRPIASTSLTGGAAPTAPTLPSVPSYPSGGAAQWVFPLAPMGAVASPRTWSMDMGVDLGGNSNQCGAHLVELAVASGTIVKLGISGFGVWTPVLRIDEGPEKGRYVYYGHAKPVLVGLGAHVAAGAPIAEVGCGIVGLSEAPHLELGMSPPGAHGGFQLPSFGQTSHEVLSDLTSAFAAAGGRGSATQRATRGIGGAGRRHASHRHRHR